jgi:hypothetical protein
VVMRAPVSSVLFLYWTMVTPGLYVSLEEEVRVCPYHVETKLARLKEVIESSQPTSCNVTKVRWVTDEMFPRREQGQPVALCRRER